MNYSIRMTIVDNEALIASQQEIEFRAAARHPVLLCD
jgi:hypothetical protein